MVELHPEEGIVAAYPPLLARAARGAPGDHLSQIAIAEVLRHLLGRAFVTQVEDLPSFRVGEDRLALQVRSQHTLAEVIEDHLQRLLSLLQPGRRVSERPG